MCTHKLHLQLPRPSQHVRIEKAMEILVFSFLPLPVSVHATPRHPQHFKIQMHQDKTFLQQTFAALMSSFLR